MKKIISVFLLLFMVMGFMPVYANPVDGGGTVSYTHLTLPTKRIV